MEHIEDFIYRGHEISLYSNGESLMFDIRDDDYDGDIIHGQFSELQTVNAVLGEAKTWIDEHIYDQTHFTKGISL